MADEQATPEGASPQNGDMDARIAQIERLLGAHNEFLRGQIQNEESARQQQEQQQDEEAQAQELQGRRGKIAQALRGYDDQPNLQGAVNFLGGKWGEEAGKYGMAQEDIDSGIMSGFERLAMAALENKMNPANVVYQYALQQGFKPAEAQAVAEQAAEEATEGGAETGSAEEAPPQKRKGAGFVEAVQAGTRPKGGMSSGKGDNFKAAMAAKAAGDMDGYARLMAG